LIIVAGVGQNVVSADKDERTKSVLTFLNRVFPIAAVIAEAAAQIRFEILAFIFSLLIFRKALENRLPPN